ncbi:hypothetical protein CLF_102162 [Clonorchis sinensis]|uniref:Uncharacterized protein n=1 Tax=Clonorchis sinensis TaxID=79923 RepID=G7Y7E1_CLOSI|nr:hypothetical protein CLF_102162 [Clonorchis sinensis]
MEYLDFFLVRLLDAEFREQSVSTFTPDQHFINTVDFIRKPIHSWFKEASDRIPGNRELLREWAVLRQIGRNHRPYYFKTFLLSHLSHYPLTMQQVVMTGPVKRTTRWLIANRNPLVDALLILRGELYRYCSQIGCELTEARLRELMIIIGTERKEAEKLGKLYPNFRTQIDFGKAGIGSITVVHQLWCSAEERAKPAENMHALKRCLGNKTKPGTSKVHKPTKMMTNMADRIKTNAHICALNVLKFGSIMYRPAQSEYNADVHRFAYLHPSALFRPTQPKIQRLHSKRQSKKLTGYDRSRHCNNGNLLFSVSASGVNLSSSFGDGYLVLGRLSYRGTARGAKCAAFLPELANDLPSFGVRSALINCKVMLLDMRSLITPPTTQNEALKVEKHFVYLGSCISFECSIIDRIDARIFKAMVAFADLRQPWCKHLRMIVTVSFLRGTEFTVHYSVLSTDQEHYVSHCWAPDSWYTSRFTYHTRTMLFWTKKRSAVMVFPAKDFAVGIQDDVAHRLAQNIFGGWCLRETLKTEGRFLKSRTIAVFSRLSSIRAP